MSLPPGFRVRLSSAVKVCDGGRTLVNGARVLLLSARAADLVRDGQVTVADETSRRLARRLLDAGAADPAWDGPAPVARDVTIVVPVRDRAVALDRLLRRIEELDPGAPLVVVDDGSRDPEAVATVAERHGAQLVRHAANRGPAAARNSGLARVRTPYVCFCDSDVVPTAGWLGGLLRHLDDPTVALVAPRVLGPEDAGPGVLARYEQVRSSLDLGERPATVRPTTSVSYVPSACLVGRVAALETGFDERMRVAEDVDLVWRLVERGWTVRYEPDVEVRHDHRDRPSAWLTRKAYYGTGAGPLARRHGSAVAPMVLTPWSAAVATALVAQRRWSVPVALVVAGVATVRLRRRLARTGRPWALAGTLVLEGSTAAVLQTSQSVVRHHWPLWALAAVGSRRARRVVVLATLLDGVLERRRRAPDIGVGAWLVLRRLDDAAYGAGVWWSALRHRAPAALLPRLRTPQSPPSGATTSPDSSQTQTGSGPPRSGWM